MISGNLAKLKNKQDTWRCCITLVLAEQYCASKLQLGVETALSFQFVIYGVLLKTRENTYDN